MKNTLLKIVSALFVSLMFTTSSFAQVVATEHFDYAVGTVLNTVDAWTAHSGNDNNSQTVIDNNLTYAGYPSMGKAISMSKTGEDVNSPFADQTDGSVYGSFLANFSDAGITTDGDYFFHFMSQGTTTFRSRVFARKDADTNKLSFGVTRGKNGVDAVWTDYAYDLNTTHLLVVKYEFVDGDANDVISLFVNPEMNSTEPAALVTNGTEDASDFSATEPLNAVALRQGNAAKGSESIIDGIKVAKSWASLWASEMSNESAMLTLGFPDEDVLNIEFGSIVNNTATITVNVAYGTNVTTMTPTMTISEGATLSPIGGVPTDFTETVTYTVTAENGTNYTMYDVVVVTGETIVAPEGLNVMVDGTTATLTYDVTSSIALTESFEEAVPPTGWTLDNTNSVTWAQAETVTFSTGNIVPVDGAFQAFLMWEYSAQDEWLITPSFNVPTGADLTFWSYSGAIGSTNGDHYYVKVSTDGGTTWTPIWDAVDAAAADYEEVTVDLTAYQGQDIKLAWQGVDGDGQGLWFTWFIDHITIGNSKDVVSFNDLQFVSKASSKSSVVSERSFSRDGSVAVVSNKSAKEFVDYTIYLNNLTTPYAENVSETSFEFTDLAVGDYTAGVQRVYTTGVSEIVTIDFNIAELFEVTFTVTSGTNNLEGASIAIDGQTLTTNASGQAMVALANGNYPYTISLAGYNNVTSEVVVAGAAISVPVAMTEMIETPFGLSVAITGYDALFTWNNASSIDDMESYDDFIIENIGNYTMIDVDGSATYGITDVDFTNTNYVGSFIVFNPSATTPALGSGWEAYSGTKYLACFAAQTPSNNDWIITPQTTGVAGLEFSFMAKSVTTNYGKERFNVAVSTTGTAQADFTVISGSTYVEAPADWTEFSYDLSAYTGQNIYVAIQCVSNDAFAFFVDDIAFGVSKAKSFTGYTVYLDGVEKAAGLTATEYAFNDLAVGNYTAGVKAVYTSGASEMVTIPFAIVTPEYDVTFTVKSAGAAVSGAKIKVGTTEKTTNASGVAVFTLVDGNYSYMVTKNNYQAADGTFIVNGANLPVAVNLTVGINDVVTSANIYPNPVSDVLLIERTSTEKAMVEVYNNNGQVVSVFETNDTVSEFNVTELTEGVYFIRIISENNSNVYRFIKK